VIYRSNLLAPDLQPYFKHVISRPMPHSQGHDVLSDFADKADDDPIFGPFKQCGFWTHDEVAILYHVAEKIKGHWLDIGAHTGWTAAHLLQVGVATVVCVDPMYGNPDFLKRTEDNLWDASYGANYSSCSLKDVTSDTFFGINHWMYDGIVIDGDHEAPQPYRDAMHAWECVSPRGVVLFHDTRIPSVQPGYRYFEQDRPDGWKVKHYTTPHGVAVCYRDPFTPPEHTPDPNIR
jgi:Methyltransferase domain